MELRANAEVVAAFNEMKRAYAGRLEHKAGKRPVNYFNLCQHCQSWAWADEVEAARDEYERVLEKHGFRYWSLNDENYRDGWSDLEMLPCAVPAGSEPLPEDDDRKARP